MRRLDRKRPPRRSARVTWDASPTTPIEQVISGLAVAARSVMEPDTIVLSTQVYDRLVAYNERTRRRWMRRERRRNVMRLRARRGRR